MAFKSNNHVERLNRFLPFSPAHDQIFEEYQRSDDSLSLKTIALKYCISSASRGANIIILTGDAGHGKTFLCRRLLEEVLGYSEDDARRLINQKSDGTSVIDRFSGSGIVQGLRIFKDISELTLETALDRIEAIETEPGVCTVICANEGRLRALLAAGKDKPVSRQIDEEFAQSFKSGLASTSGRVHVVNLNYQSISAAGKPRSLIVETVHQWTDGRRWQECSQCDARGHCPILANQRLLATSSGLEAETRQKNLETLFATVERLGSVVTIRELLMVTAFALTSGLLCKDVESRVQRGKPGWQNKHIFYNTLFACPPNLSKDRMRHIPVLLEIRRLDPGLQSKREIDEKIINTQGVFPEGEIDLKFRAQDNGKLVVIDAANGIDEIIGVPTSRKERNQEASLVESVVRSLRRRAYFDGVMEGKATSSSFGFKEGKAFEDVVGDKLPPTHMARLKRRVIAGLHTIQGLQMGEDESNLHLVDPAFGNATSHAAIIAARIPASSVSLIPASERWNISESERPRALECSVNWLDREIICRIRGQSGERHDLPLDLMVLDAVIRAGGGYVAEQFYAHEMQRITSFLGRLAEVEGKAEAGISLYFKGSVRDVTIDEGLIQVSGDY